MNLNKFMLIASLFAMATSCTLEKTDFEAEIDRSIPESNDFKEVTSLSSGNYQITIEALNGTFYKGYNEIRLRIANKQTGEELRDAAVNFSPIHMDASMLKTSCPHRNGLIYESDQNYYSGYVVFTSISAPKGRWDLYFDITHNNQIHSGKQMVSVENQSNQNLNMTAFTDDKGKEYIIALVNPKNPKVSENKLVAGIYTSELLTEPKKDISDSIQITYSEADDYTLLLDPRMPEPSMGNHSSPNNKDLTQQDDGLYHGVVNYTMTGAWTLNFILLDQHGKIIKGTEVSTDFTPGIEGEKSELFIDTFF